MDPKLILVKAIMLLFRESQLKEQPDSSKDLVRTALDLIPTPDITAGVVSNRDVIRSLKSVINEMIGQVGQDEQDKDQLLSTLKISCDFDEKLYEMFYEGITKEIEESGLKKSIISYRRSIANFYKEKQAEAILNKAAYEVKFNRDKIPNFNEFVLKVIQQLEPLQVLTSSKDPAIIDNVDIGDEAAVNTVFEEIEYSNSSEGILRTGWQDINDMLQGGFRRGDFVEINALQHKYKTGFTLSLFKQIATHNKPFMINPAKKPLLLRISFEDDLKDNIQTLYQLMKFEETGIDVDIKDATISKAEKSAYVKAKLQSAGYHVKMLRVDPTMWTYKHICNKIVELESEGYEIHLLMLDYLSKVPTTGCSIGGTGTDMRDMFSRMYNFTKPRKITLVTPHQISTEAKTLIRAGIPEEDFVKNLPGKGYTEGSKQLDQVIDIEIYLHVFKSKGSTYLSVQLGKRRLPTVVDDEYRYVLYKFPPRSMPICEDLHKERAGMRKLPNIATSSAFDF